MACAFHLDMMLSLHVEILIIKRHQLALGQGRFISLKAMQKKFMLSINAKDEIPFLITQ